MTHICVSKLTIIGSDNGLSPVRRQAIIWTNDGMLLIRTLGTNFNEILSEIHAFSFKKMHLKMSSAKWRSVHDTHCNCQIIDQLRKSYEKTIFVKIWDTVGCRYTAIHYITIFYMHNPNQSIHKRYPTPCPYGQAMGCLFWKLLKTFTTWQRHLTVRSVAETYPTAIPPPPPPPPPPD